VTARSLLLLLRSLGAGAVKTLQAQSRANSSGRKKWRLNRRYGNRGTREEKRSQGTVSTKKSAGSEEPRAQFGLIDATQIMVYMLLKMVGAIVDHARLSMLVLHMVLHGAASKCCRSLSRQCYGLHYRCYIVLHCIVLP
jgi:hypothetical protein